MKLCRSPAYLEKNTQKKNMSISSVFEKKEKNPDDHFCPPPRGYQLGCIEQIGLSIKLVNDEQFAHKI